MDKLKPCPFCGGEAIHVIAKHGESLQSAKIECIHCGCSSLSMAAYTKEKAKKSARRTWNKRKKGR